MSTLLSFENVSLAYGLEPLLEKAKFQVMSGERICLIGRNGAGKSSLLKVVEGNLLPDSGTVWRKPHLRIARLAQELPQASTATVYEFVASGLSEAGKLLAAYHEMTHRLSDSATEKDLLHLGVLQQKIDAIQGWQFEQQIEAMLTRLDLNPDRLVSELSGGWQRRAALAQALVSSPELLLLDEPTNHLDISAIQWLEEQLLGANTGLLFITHDRSLLKRLATRIIELDRGQLTSWPGDYDQYLLHKSEWLLAEEKHHADFDKKLAQEEKWIRQGIKARRTRNEGRVRALESMRRLRAKRRNIQGKATIHLSAGETSGQLVVEALNISKQFHHNPIIKDFSIRVMRGDKIALIGPNGVGKTTLISILLGHLLPDSGNVTQGTKWQVAYFDQLRQALNPEKTVMDNVAEGRDFIEINGRQQHVISYLNDFLFTPQRAMTQVKALSGGECNRILLAKLFSQPANILVLDEPTNDLDIETLEILEERLVNFEGTILLVSHDRTFVDNVVTSTLVFDGQGGIQEYVGGYQDACHALAKSIPVVKPLPKAAPTVPVSPKVKKLSYKEQRELEMLPKQIEDFEKERQSLQLKIASPDFYKNNVENRQVVLNRLQTIEQALTTAYDRWAVLEGSQQGENT